MTFFAVRITKHSGLDGDYRMLLRGSSLYAILSRHRGHHDGQHRQNRHVVSHPRNRGAALRLRERTEAGLRLHLLLTGGERRLRQRHRLDVSLRLPADAGDMGVAGSYG